MTKIGTIGGVVAPRRMGRTGGAFALPPADGGIRTSSAAAAQEVAALLSLQEEGPPAEPAGERAARRANAALDELRGLQLDLLRGRHDPGRLDRLAELSGSQEVRGDPELRAVVEEVAIRVRVELTRRRLSGEVRVVAASGQ
jgi:hypothetical protein